MKWWRDSVTAGRNAHLKQNGSVITDAVITVDQAVQFCAHLGTGCELWDTADVPTDRRHRDAWRRSHNGGPIWLDQRKVVKIDERRMWRKYEVTAARHP